MARNRVPGGKEGHPEKPKVNPIELKPTRGINVPEYVNPGTEPQTVYWYMRLGALALELGTLNKFTEDSMVTLARAKADIEEMRAELAKVNEGRPRGTIRMNMHRLTVEVQIFMQQFGLTPAQVLKSGTVKGAAPTPGRGYLEKALPEIEAKRIADEYKNWEPPQETKVADVG